MGNTSAKSVQLGNLLTARTLVILLICAAKQVWFILEQPSSSLMEYHVLFQRFLALIPLRKLAMNMGDFGSATLKPTHLYSSVLTQSIPKISLVSQKMFFQKQSYLHPCTVSKTMFLRNKSYTFLFQKHDFNKHIVYIPCFKNIFLETNRTHPLFPEHFVGTKSYTFPV